LSTKKSDLYEVYKKFNDTLEVINSKYTQVEKDSFEIKRQEAEKVLNDENYISSFLTALCVE
jgi:septum formation topological specificity factor MinE